MNRTPFYQWHTSNHGRMVDFAGWEMPIQYSTIIAEHNAVRTAAGLFDIAHMGRIEVTGPDAEAALDYLLTNDVTKLKHGQVRYSLMTNEQGMILDDVLVYRFQNSYLLVVNASNREKILAWIPQHSTGFNASFKDLTFSHAMVALQGPNAVQILKDSTEQDFSGMKYYTAKDTEINSVPAIISRTGYTGEDGFEIILANSEAIDLWETLIKFGTPHGIVPAGLGCRDTLRLEAAMPLYGHELDEQTDPLTAGIDFAVKLDAGNFIGRDALLAIRERQHLQKRVGLKLQGKRIAREGTPIYAGDTLIGKVTSGTFSPTLEESIAMGYVPAEHTAPGTTLEVDLRGKRESATVTPLPFYKRK